MITQEVADQIVGWILAVLVDEDLVALEDIPDPQLQQVRAAVQMLKEDLSHAQSELFSERGKLATVVDNVLDGLLVCDDGGDVLWANRAASVFFGRAPADLVGQSLGLPTVGGDQVHGFREDGGVAVATVGRVPIMWSDGPAYLVTLSDITDRLELERLARHDDLTSLPNRSFMVERITTALFEAAQEDRSVWLMFLDLDDFKEINDRFGHSSGDLVLKRVAQRLRANLRPSDIVGRIGGDEFLVLCHQIEDPAELQGIANRVAEVLDEPIQLGAHSVRLRASVGIAEGSHTGLDAETFIANADLAMYEAKGSGKGQQVLFRERMRTSLHERVNMVSALRYAIHDGQLRPYFQPIVDQQGRLTGAETLVRWERGPDDVLSAGSFIRVAENHGLMTDLGKATIDRSIAEVATILQRVPEGSGLRWTLNLSPAQLVDGATIDLLVASLEQYGVDPHRIGVELTENAIARETDALEEVIDRIASSGMELLIDDFGTGYSNLAYLQRFPISALKIDRSFTLGVVDDPHATALVRSQLQLADNLSLQTIAEGVETPEHHRVLRDLGCVRMQGFLYGRAVPGARLATWLEEFGMEGSMLADPLT